MDVEGTIQFILQSQAQMEANIGRHDELLASLTTSHNQLAKTQDRLSASFLELNDVMRALAIAQAETEAQVKDLARMQKETREDLNVVIRTMDDWIRRKPQ